MHLYIQNIKRTKCIIVVSAKAAIVVLYVMLSGTVHTGTLETINAAIKAILLTSMFQVHVSTHTNRRAKWWNYIVHSILLD